MALMGLGAWLFMLAVQDAREGTGRTLTGLLSVFCLTLGFGLLLIPPPLLLLKKPVPVPFNLPDS